MLILLNDIKIRSIIDHMLNDIERYSKAHEIVELRKEAKTKKPSLQLYRKIRAIVVKILCNANQFELNIHFITENIFTQTTYYKTLTSRP